MEMTPKTINHSRPASHDECLPEEQIIRSAADHAVKKTFAILGVDIDDPESIEEFRQDLRFGKRMRKMSDHGQLALAGMFFVGLGWAIFEGIRAKFGMH